MNIGKILDEELNFEVINTLAKAWSTSRSTGDIEQDKQCEYDYKQGLLAARRILKSKEL